MIKALIYLAEAFMTQDYDTDNEYMPAGVLLDKISAHADASLTQEDLLKLYKGSDGEPPPDISAVNPSTYYGDDKFSQEAFDHVKNDAVVNLGLKPCAFAFNGVAPDGYTPPTPAIAEQKLEFDELVPKPPSNFTDNIG